MTQQELNKLYQNGFTTHIKKTVLGDKNRVYDDNWLQEVKNEKVQKK